MKKVDKKITVSSTKLVNSACSMLLDAATDCYVYLSSAYAILMFRDVCYLRCMRILITFLAHEFISASDWACCGSMHNTWNITSNFTHHMWRGCSEYGTNILNLKSLRVYVSLCIAHWLWHTNGRYQQPERIYSSCATRSRHTRY